ncbi:hypothetical protein BN14_10471 [Rhizoctonia solani AG-1 IB]|uniref:Uncharacterized protein n=1 Tax=Thanatephorus cucumeris (strain AG1-IB / isolate 7/3/14) TaxID=1108050 RepID=M5CGL7_THACB|nr:hypothetical protein BN14_10471 [Rhizoctonia solani AG-1 IB]
MPKWQPKANQPLLPGNLSIKDSAHPLGKPLLTQDPRPWMTVAKTKEATKDVRATVKNISQQVDNIAGKVNEPRTLDQGNPTTMVDQTPNPKARAQRKTASQTGTTCQH